MKRVRGWRCYGCQHPADWLCLQRRGQECRWRDMETGRQVGPVQANVAPAWAWAVSVGLKSLTGRLLPREDVVRVLEAHLGPALEPAPIVLVVKPRRYRHDWLLREPMEGGARFKCQRCLVEVMAALESPTSSRLEVLQTSAGDSWWEPAKVLPPCVGVGYDDVDD